MADSSHTTARQRNDLKRAAAREETRIAIAEGRVTVRKMTKKEQAEADRRHAEREAARAARGQRFAR
jgi:hypothetical protein